MLNIRECYEYCNRITILPYLLEEKKRKVGLEEFSTYVYQEPYERNGEINARWSLTELGNEQVLNYHRVVRDPTLAISIPHMVRLLNTITLGEYLWATDEELAEYDDKECCEYLNWEYTEEKGKKAVRMMHYRDQVEKKDRTRRKEKVESWESAEKLGCLKTYFKEYDIFHVALNERSDVLVNYSGDYFNYIVERYTLKQRAEMYQQYLYTTAKKTDYVEVDYRLQVSDSFFISLSQLPQYEYVINQYKRVALPSDGIGVASMYCIKHDIDYVSWEPNGVGNIARMLGIINSKDPIYDETRTYLFFYCVQYYSVPMFLGQQFVVWDVTHMKKPGLQIMPEISANCPFDKREWERRYRSKYMVLTSFFSVDEGAKNMLRNIGVEEVRVSEAQYIVATSQSTVEKLIGIGFYTTKYHIDYEKRNQKNFRSFGSKGKYVIPIIDENYVMELRNRTLVITEKSFPFRESFTHRPGRMKVYVGDKMERHHGADRYYDDGYMSSINTTVGLPMLVANYEIVQGVFVIKLLNPSITRHIYLNDEHVNIYKTNVLKVYMVATYKVKTGYLVLYVPDYELRPNIPTLQDEPEIVRMF